MSDNPFEYDDVDIHGFDSHDAVLPKKLLMQALEMCENSYKSEQELFDSDVALLEHDYGAVATSELDDGTKMISFRGTHIDEDAIMNSINSLVAGTLSGVGTIPSLAMLLFGSLYSNKLVDVLDDTDNRFIPLDNAFGLDMTHHNSELNGVVTVGFARHLERMYKKVKEDLDGEEDFVIVGHSLGAVSAQLFALRYYLETDKKPKAVITFGSPKGFQHISRSGTRFLYPTYTINHIDDVVTYGYPILQGELGYVLLLNSDNYQTMLHQPHNPFTSDEQTHQFMLQVLNQNERTSLGDGIVDRVKGGLNFFNSMRSQVNKLAMAKVMNTVRLHGISSHYLSTYRQLLERLHVNEFRWENIDRHRDTHISSDEIGNRVAPQKEDDNISIGSSIDEALDELDDTTTQSQPQQNVEPLPQVGVTTQPEVSVPLNVALLPQVGVPQLYVVPNNFTPLGFVLYPEHEKNKFEYQIISYR